MAEINYDVLQNFEHKILEITVDNLEVITGHSFSVTLAEIVDYASAEKSSLGGSLEVRVTFASQKYDEWRFYIPTDLGALLATSMVGEDPVSYDAESHLEPLQELMAQVLSPYLSELSSIETAQIDTSGLEIEQITEVSDLGEQYLLLEMNCTVDDTQEYSIFKVVPNSLIANLNGSASPQESNETPAGDQDEEIVDVNGADFQPLQGNGQNGKSVNLDMLMDLEMPINIELGRTKQTIKSILQLGQGSIIELDKLSGDPVDVYINDRKFAEGEVVVVDENFGVRITEIVSPVEKIKALQ